MGYRGSTLRAIETFSHRSRPAVFGNGAHLLANVISAHNSVGSKKRYQRRQLTAPGGRKERFSHLTALDPGTDG